MSDVPISYFKAVRSSGKFQPSNPPDLETPPPVINPPGSGGGVNLFKNLGDVTDRSFLGKNGYVPVVTAENLLSLQPLPQVPDNGLISGGIVQWTGTGYVFNISSCFYRISGEPYSTDPTQKTLSTPDVTNNRIDVFAVDINSSVVVIEGTPSATPVKPQIDPSTQIELTSVIVTASSTEPTLTEEIIYDENIEWTGTSAGTGTVSFNSAVDPFEGTVSIETTDIQNGFIVKLTNSIDVDISTFQTLGFQLNLKASMPSNQNLYGLFINSAGDAVSNKFLLNFDKTLAGSYQFIGIALNTLSFTSNDIRSIYFSFERLAGSPTYSGFFLDVVRLEGGINPPVNVGSFLNLTDTPNTYLGQSGKSVTVKADESGLEFSTGGGGSSTFLALTDTPSTYVGQAGLFPRVNVGETALAFDSVSPYDLDQEGASDGQVLTWVTANSRYEPVTPSGGGGISGLTTNTIPKATSATTIGDSRLFDDGTSAYFTNQSTNTFFGDLAGNSSDLLARSQTAFGRQAGESNVSGTNWVAIGVTAGRLNATGSSWLAIGTLVGNANTAGSSWIGIGVQTGQNATGSSWVGIGQQAGQNATGNNWTAIGTFAGRRYLDNTNANFSNGVYIGYNTRVGATNATNEIVIGYLADGNGSNTATLGNNSITATYLKGDIYIEDTENLVFDVTTGSKIGTATSQKISFWNKTPIIQPNTGISAATFVANTSGIVNDTATFGGYTIGQIAAALINTGLLA